MAEQSYHIEVRLAGRDLTAERIHARDAASLIAAVESMLSATVPQVSGVSLTEADVVISLAELRPNGYALVFATPQPEMVETAFAALAEAIDSRQLESLPARAIESLREIRRIARKYTVEVEFAGRSAGKRSARKAALLPDTPITSDVRGIRGTTSLYGTVIRVGGEEPPRARLRLLSGTLITCELARRKSWALARELGARLYQVVGVRGESTINIADRSIIHFRIDRVLPYSSTGMDRALSALSDAAGEVFHHIPDIASPALSLRGEDEG